MFGPPFGVLPGGCTQEGARVQFRIADVFLPGAEELTVVPSAQTVLEGTVVGFSDAGSAPSFFALVDVAVRKTVVVPVEKLQWLETQRR